MFYKVLPYLTLLRLIKTCLLLIHLNLHVIQGLDAIRAGSRGNQLIYCRPAKISFTKSTKFDVYLAEFS